MARTTSDCSCSSKNWLVLCILYIFFSTSSCYGLVISKRGNILSRRCTQLFENASNDPTESSSSSSPIFTRRKVWNKVAQALAVVSLPANAADGQVKVTQTKSGLKYIDLVEGTGASPQYGQLVSFAYKAYIQLPANKNEAKPQPQLFDQVDGYLTKHGNGRLIAGLDEGLHSLRVGGERRIIIPPKLGFVDSGLGPMPQYPWNRTKLNNLLEQMIKLSGGTLIYQVTMLNIIDDEADQGYYQDDSLTPEQFDTLRRNLQEKAAKARKEQEMQDQLSTEV